VKEYFRLQVAQPPARLYPVSLCSKPGTLQITGGLCILPGMF